MDKLAYRNKVLELPKFEFEPLYYVFDKCKHRVLVAKKQDRYEIKGKWISRNKETFEWEVYEASLNGQSLWEFPTRYVPTKDADEVTKYLDFFAMCPLPSDNWCTENHPRAEDFPVS